jgi:hypothetical protein
MSVREDEYANGLSHLKQSRTTDTTGTKIANMDFVVNLCGLCARP